MDESTVRHIATLARLSLNEAELARLASDLAKITEYLSQLRSVDVTGVEMTVHPGADRNQWREDAAQPFFTREQAVANAPDSEQSFFKVPPVIE